MVKRKIYTTSKASAEELDAFWRGDKDTYLRLYNQRKKAESDALNNTVSNLESKGTTITYNPRNNELKEVVITAKGPSIVEKAWDNTSTDDKIDAAITIASFIPGLDTAADIADSANQFRQGNWGWGLLGLGATFVPGLSMPYIRKGWDLYKKSKVAKAIDSDISRKIWEYNKHPQWLSPDKAEIPIQKGYMYHTNSRPNGGIVRNGHVVNRNYPAGSTTIIDNKYASVRGNTTPESDRIWWDLKNHNRGEEVLVTKEGGMRLTDPNSGAIPGKGYYEDSYRTTYRPNVSEVIRFKYDPIGDTYTAYSPYRKITTNKMTLDELFTPENIKSQTYPKTSLAFFEKTPQSVNPKGSWTYPYTNNMGEYDFKSNSVNTNNFGELLGEGSEQVVFTNLQEPEKVLKIYNDVGHKSLNDLRKFVKHYQTRNNVPFQLPTTFEGYVTNKGLKYPVFSQKRVTNTIPLGLDNWNNNIIPRLNEQMKSVGFEGNGYYTRGSREIGDIQPNNLIELPNGQFRFIDAYPEGFKKGGKL